MRHKVKSTTLGRNTAQRKSLLRNLVDSLIIHESIKTTKMKAKLLSAIIDRVICRTKKKDKSSAIRYISKYLFTKAASTKLVDDISWRYQNRDSWFTRSIRLERRKWDNSEMVQIQFV